MRRLFPSLKRLNQPKIANPRSVTLEVIDGGLAMSERKQKKRARKSVKQELTNTINQLHMVMLRCHANYLEALEAASEQDVSLEDFSQPEWDCRNCSLFMKCLMAQNFEPGGHPNGWRFSWYEKELDERKDVA